MAARIAAHDWAATPLGPLDGWPQHLRTALGVMLRSPLPMTVVWGDEGLLFYTDVFARTAVVHGLPAIWARTRTACFSSDCR